MAVILVVVGLLAALVISARVNPVYQSRALVAVQGATESRPNSLEQNLALARSRTLRLAVGPPHGSAGRVNVSVVDELSLEFRARSHRPAAASEAANAYARTFVELRRNQLREENLTDRGAGPSRLRHLPRESAGPSVVVPARPARSPLPPWPSEEWAVAAMFLLALALTIPEADSPDKRR